jgi:cell division inhibitor SepF
MVYLGLQDDDEYGYDPYGTDAPYADGYPDPGHRPAPGRGDNGPGPGLAHDDPYGVPRPYPEPRGGDVRPLGSPDPRMVVAREGPEPRGFEGRGHDGPGYGEPAVRSIPRDEQPSGVSVSRPGVVRAVPTTAGKVHVVEPRGFNDAQQVGDRVKGNQAVILNLQSSDKELRRRLIDFSSGLAYATGGSMSRVADAVFLISPLDVEISEEEKDRLEARGLYRRD